MRGKRITKEGRKELRWAMVEVAWRAVKACYSCPISPVNGHRTQAREYESLLMD